MRRRYLRNRARGNIIYPGLIAAWSAKGKTNDDADRNVLKDLTGNGHDITLNRFAFSEMSGYGGYNVNFSNWNNYVNDHKILLSNSKKASRIYATYLPSFKIKVSGLNGEILQYFIKVTSKNITYNIVRDGEYVLPKGVEEDINSGSYYHEFALYYATEDTTNIIIEQLPEYPDALVFDGVDDYGINENMPILTDYTIIGKRKYIGEYSSEKYTFTAKGISPNREFLMELTSISSVDSFGARNKITIDYNNLITWQNKSSYNQQKITAGSEIGDDNIFYIGKLSGNSEWWFKGAFYSAYLFDRSLDEQEIKEFIRKYIDPEYLLPSEIPTPDCYYDFSLGSNNDENRDTIVDQSGNSNDAVAHNFAWSGMSGYGGYNIDFTEWDASRTDNVKTKTSITITRVNDAGYKTFQIMNTTDSVMIIPSFKVRIKGLSSYTDIKLRYYFGGEEPFELQKDGDYILPEATITNKFSTAGFQILSVNDSNDHVGKDINITIELLPQYEGALVLDGVDDYISLDAFDSGFKTVFMVCNWNNENAFLYDQRQFGTSGNQWGIYTAQTAYSYRNAKGVTYINSILNTSLLSNNLLQKKHCITIVNENIEPNRIPIIGAAVDSASSFANIALYKFLGFKEKLTEDQIQYVIKKYNLLDGVDEIEVS